MVFGLSALNRVYNFKRVCPGPVLDRVWLQDRRRVFGNPKSETLVCIYFSEQCVTSIEFPLSGDRSENSNFFLFAPKDPFGELFSKIIFKSSSEFFLRQKLGKFEIGLNVPDGPIEIMQISTFSKLSFKTRQRFLELTLSQSFLHPFCLLPNYILSRPEHFFI